jgi:hypothetical protein
MFNANMGTIGMEIISYGGLVSDSFTLAGTSTLTGVNLGIWIASGNTPDQLSWRISDSYLTTITPSDHGTQAFLTDVTKVCTGCVTIANIPGNDVYSASFSLPNLVEGPGTHFLTLDYGSGGGTSLYWDVSNGPSQAFVNGVNAQTDLHSNSNSFEILGTTNDSTASPEPAGTAMLLSGLALVAGLARRGMRA